MEEPQRCWFSRGCSADQSALFVRMPSASQSRETKTHRIAKLVCHSHGNLIRTQPGGSAWKLLCALYAWYGDDNADSQTKDMEKCGICGGTPPSGTSSRDSVLRLIPQATARNIKGQ
jgi:hypothetical protein